MGGEHSTSIHLFVFSCLDKEWILTVTRNVVHKWKQWASAKIRLGSNLGSMSREHSLLSVPCTILLEEGNYFVSGMTG